VHLDTACCGVPISAVLTGAGVHDSRGALPLTRLSAQRVDACHERMDAAYCSHESGSHFNQGGIFPAPLGRYSSFYSTGFNFNAEENLVTASAGKK
jgi:hypothetical protein